MPRLVSSSVLTFLLLCCTQLDRLSAQTLVVDLFPNGNSDPTELTDVDGTLFFAALNPNASRELHKTDGTAAGTTLIKDIAVGLASSAPRDLVALGPILLFTADDTINGRELWRSDGTADGTKLVKDITPGRVGSELTELAIAGGLLFFRVGSDLWRSDGTTAGTIRIGRDLAPAEVTPFGNRVIFRGERTPTDLELFTSDGTETGTVLLKDIGDGSSRPGFFAAGRTRFFFMAFTSNSFALFKSDGTDAGTTLVKRDVAAVSLATVDDNVFFVNFESSSGEELWFSDGTEDGTQLVRDIASGAPSSDIRSLTPVDGNVLFFANDRKVGLALWKSDGTEAGTVLVKDIHPTQIGDPFGEKIARLGSGHVVFSANDSAGPSNFEPWISDGSDAGTRMIKDIAPSPRGSDPTEFTRSGRLFYFSAGEPKNGTELWAGDANLIIGTLVHRIGRGCRGSNGVPVLGGFGLPKLGNSTFTLNVTNARALSATLFLVSNTLTDVRLGGGCTAYVAPPVMTVSFATDARGVAVAPTPIPNARSLIGLDMLFQVAVVDPNGAFGGVAITNALQIIIGT